MGYWYKMLILYLEACADGLLLSISSYLNAVTTVFFHLRLGGSGLGLWNTCWYSTEVVLSFVFFGLLLIGIPFSVGQLLARALLSSSTFFIASQSKALSWTRYELWSSSWIFSWSACLDFFTGLEWSTSQCFEFSIPAVKSKSGLVKCGLKCSESGDSGPAVTSNSVPWFVVVPADDADGVFSLHEKVDGSLVDWEAIQLLFMSFQWHPDG